MSNFETSKLSVNMRNTKQQKKHKIQKLNRSFQDYQKCLLYTVLFVMLVQEVDGVNIHFNNAPITTGSTTQTNNQPTQLDDPHIIAQVQADARMAALGSYKSKLLSTLTVQKQSIWKQQHEHLRNVQPGNRIKHVYSQFTGDGLPLYKALFMVIIDQETGEIITSSSLWSLPENFNPVPTKTASRALNAALKDYCNNECTYSKESVTLVAAPFNDGVLAWLISFHPSNSLSPVVYCLSDSTLSILEKYNGQFNINAIGTSAYNGVVSFNTSQVGSTYYMENLAQRSTVFDCQGGNCSISYRMSDSDNVWNATSQKNAVNVAWGSSQVLQYYSNILGRNNIDNDGMTSPNIGPLVYSADGSTTLFPHYVNYGPNFDDVTYTPSGIYYGIGDGVNYSSIVSLDIIGHEMFHGVLLSNSSFNTTYPVGQTGALTEAYCDIFGAMAERYTLGESNNTWRIGEDFYTPNISGDALRFLDYPHNSANIAGLTTNGNPDHMNDYYNGTGDNSGIHINCGIPSKAFYLLAKGGQSPYGGPILQGLGTDAAAAIWYRAIFYLTPYSTFTNARTAVGQAVKELYNNCVNCLQFAEAMSSWGGVGVGVLANFTSTIFTSTFESDALPFSLYGGNAVFLMYGGTGGHSSRGYLQLGGYVSATGSAVCGPWNVSTVTNALTLSFWIKVASAEPLNLTTVRDSLNVNIRDYNTGLVLSTVASYSNLSPRNATYYVQKSIFGLGSIVGTSLFTISFDVGNDATCPTTFSVDDVSLSSSQN